MGGLRGGLGGEGGSCALYRGDCHGVEGGSDGTVVEVQWPVCGTLPTVRVTWEIVLRFLCYWALVAGQLPAALPPGGRAVAFSIPGQGLPPPV